jgi:hypothetical protein
MHKKIMYVCDINLFIHESAFKREFKYHYIEVTA